MVLGLRDALFTRDNGSEEVVKYLDVSNFTMFCVAKRPRKHYQDGSETN